MIKLTMVFVFLDKKNLFFITYSILGSLAFLINLKNTSI